MDLLGDSINHEVTITLSDSGKIDLTDSGAMSILQGGLTYILEKTLTKIREKKGQERKEKIHHRLLKILKHYNRRKNEELVEDIQGRIRNALQNKSRGPDGTEVSTQRTPWFGNLIVFTDSRPEGFRLLSIIESDLINKDFDPEKFLLETIKKFNSSRGTTGN